jgi:alpha-beta hydrolase superfamily lysophospholipase
MQALVAPSSHQLSAADGTSLYVSDYLLPSSGARGSIVIMHGLGEHSGRYRHVAQFFNACGLSVRCYDHRGHGRSSGDRGDVINGDPMLQDAQIVIDNFAAQYRQPPFLFGHSMGGLFAARYALSERSRLRGLILSSPALAVRLSPPQRVLLKALHAVAPRLGVPNGLKPAYLSHDPAVVAAYKADPLVHNKISARLLASMLRSIAFCEAHAGELALPTLMVVAGEDRLVDAEGSRRFFAAAPPGMAELRVYPGFYHEVFNEPDSDKPFGDVRAWLAARYGIA